MKIFNSKMNLNKAENKKFKKKHEKCKKSLFVKKSLQLNKVVETS